MILPYHELTVSVNFLARYPSPPQGGLLNSAQEVKTKNLAGDGSEDTSKTLKKLQIHLRHLVGKAISDYNMIEDGDRSTTSFTNRTHSGAD